MRQSPDLRTWRLRCVTPGRVVTGGNAIGASAWAHQRQNNFGNTILAGSGDRYPVFGQIRWCDPPLALENVSRCRHSMSGGLESSPDASRTIARATPLNESHLRKPDKLLSLS